MESKTTNIKHENSPRFVDKEVSEFEGFEKKEKDSRLDINIESEIFKGEDKSNLKFEKADEEMQKEFWED